MSGTLGGAKPRQLSARVARSRKFGGSTREAAALSTLPDMTKREHRDAFNAARLQCRAAWGATKAMNSRSRRFCQRRVVE